jgi:splicing factor 3B subunit 3
LFGFPGALEKQKFVYVLNRDAATRLTISSPLEAHKSNIITFHLIGLDVAFDNPIFAAIEADYTGVEPESDDSVKFDPTTYEKVLTYYELDLGLNHVARKWTEAIDPSSNLLIQVPGGKDGPSGVMVCAENWVHWKHQGEIGSKVPIPRRINYLEDPNRGLMIVCSVTHRLKNRFFILIQSEEGDLYRLTMQTNEDGTQELSIKYFDTIPVASSLVILKSGFILAISEFGNHYLYRIDDLGDSDEEQVDYTSSQDISSFVYFKPRDLRNLSLVHSMNAANPILDAKVLNLGQEESPQLYAICGRGAQSTFRIMRPGLDLAEIAVTEVPGNPTSIWTTKLRSSDLVDSYIVVSFVNATVVFSIGESVEEINDSGLLPDVSTLLVRQIGDDDLVQVHPEGIRHIKSDKRTFEWKVPANNVITKVTANQRQILISLNDYELIYFELDAAGLLNEFPERRTSSSSISCLEIGEVPYGRLRNRFSAIGCADNTVRILSLDPDTCLEDMSMQALNSTPESLCIIDMRDPSKNNERAMYLNIGLNNGVLIRSTLNQLSGELLDSRLRFLGPKTPKLFRVVVGGENAMVALSTRTWVNYMYQGRIMMSPVNYEALEQCAAFCSETYPEAIVATSKNTVRILALENVGTWLNQQSIELTYTPRKFAHHPISNHFVILEADQNTFSPEEATHLLHEKSIEFEDEGVLCYREEFPEAQYGLIKAAPGKWASCIRVLNPIDGITNQMINLSPDEAAFSLAIVIFASQPQEVFLCVGTVSGLVYPNNFTSAAIRTYRFSDNGTYLEFVHSTPVEDIPRAMHAFQGRVLAGIGNTLRIYDFGKKKLLRKSENRQIPKGILSIESQGNRLYVTDIQESVHYAMYRYQDNRIVVFADDCVPRWVTCMAVLDYDTVVGGDRFGNIFINRLSRQLSKEIEEDVTGNRIMYEKAFLNGAAHKLEHVANYYVGDWVVSIEKVVLVPGGREVLLYTTLGGVVGALIPYGSRDDADFFQMLEIQMRQECESLVGRDHLRYRSMFAPVKVGGSEPMIFEWPQWFQIACSIVKLYFKLCRTLLMETFASNSLHYRLIRKVQLQLIWTAQC